MLNKELAPLGGPLGNSPTHWEGLEEYLKALHQLTIRGLVTAQLEPELRQLQGKVALLEMLLNLKNNYNEVIRNKNVGDNN